MPVKPFIRVGYGIGCMFPLPMTPQYQTEPSVSAATVRYPPAAIALTVIPAGGHEMMELLTGSMYLLTLTGEALNDAPPLPSCPKALSPQVKTVPSLFRAME